MTGIDRRSVLIGSAAILAARPSRAEELVEQLLADIFGDRKPKSGVIQMKLSPLAENGLAVPVTLAVSDPPAQVKRIVLLAPGNPFPRAAEYRFGPRAGKAEIATRIR